MATSGIHQPEALTRYALRELTGQELKILTGHLDRCGPCRQFVSFIRRFHDVLQKGKGESPTAGEACPEPALIVALVAGELNQDVAKHVDAHLLFCH